MWMSIIGLQWHRFLVVRGLPIIIFRAPHGGVNLLLQKRSCSLLVGALNIVFQTTIIPFFDLKKKKMCNHCDEVFLHIHICSFRWFSSTHTLVSTSGAVVFLERKMHQRNNCFPTQTFELFSCSSLPFSTTNWPLMQLPAHEDDDDGIWSKL